jgi:hypothetical protein
VKNIKFFFEQSTAREAPAVEHQVFLTEWGTLEGLLSPFSMPCKQNHLSFVQGSFSPFVYLLLRHTFVLHIERHQTRKQDCEHLIM